MDQMIFNLMENVGGPAFAGAVAVFAGIFGWAFYKTLINVFFNAENIDQLGDAVKKYLKRIPDESARNLTKNRIAAICVEILKDLGYAKIVSPNAANVLKQEKLNALK